MRLARTLPAQLLPIHAPHPPDFYVCSTTYGTNIVPWDCQFNVDTYWRSGATPVHYYFSRPVPSNAIPLPFITSTIGWDSSCQIAIEPAGPNYGSLSYLAFSPDKLRGLAGYIIQKCAQEGNGKGGFVTVGLDRAEHYLQNWIDSKDQGTEKNASGSDPSPHGAYITISINGKDRTGFAPGDTDPAVAGYLSKYAARMSQLFNEQLAPWQALGNYFRHQALTLGRGGDGDDSASRIWWTGKGLTGSNETNTNRAGSQSESIRSDWTKAGVGPWKNIGAGSDQQPQGEAGNAAGDVSNQGWVIAEEDGQMNYLCDTSSSPSLLPASKGTTTPAIGPDPIDCERLSWSGLPGSSNPESLLTLEYPSPSSSTLSNNSIGEPLLFTYGTCTLAVFATNPQLPAPSRTSLGSVPTLPSTVASKTPNGSTTISWAHILAAFHALTNLCVANPVGPLLESTLTRGGVAYWSQQGQGSRVGFKVGRGTGN